MSAWIYILVGAVLALVGAFFHARYVTFWGQRPEDYSDGPAFDIRERFNGPMACDGVIFGPSGRVSSRFTAEFDARWEGDRCIMDEVFHYDSGTTQRRQWRLALAPDGRITAEADDVVGTGTGRQEGSAVLLEYRLRLTPEAGGHVLSVTDWMYLTPGGAIMNRSQFRKFGIKVAELVATMRPRDAETARKAA